jgi:hypothetical protein
MRLLDFSETSILPDELLSGGLEPIDMIAGIEEDTGQEEQY